MQGHLVGGRASGTTYSPPEKKAVSEWWGKMWGGNEVPPPCFPTHLKALGLSGDPGLEVTISTFQMI